MSIFDNVSRPCRTPEIEMLVKLKYGEISHDVEWLRTLPEAVIRTAFRHVIIKILKSNDYEVQVQTFSILLRQPINKQETTQALTRALVEYHTLLG